MPLVVLFVPPWSRPSRSRYCRSLTSSRDTPSWGRAHGQLTAHSPPPAPLYTTPAPGSPAPGQHVAKGAGTSTRTHFPSWVFLMMNRTTLLTSMKRMRRPMSPPTTPTMISVTVLSASTTAGEKVLRGLRRGAGSSQLHSPPSKAASPSTSRQPTAEGHEPKPCPSGMPTTSKKPGHPMKHHNCELRWGQCGFASPPPQCRLRGKGALAGTYSSGPP